MVSSSSNLLDGLVAGVCVWRSRSWEVTSLESLCEVVDVLDLHSGLILLGFLMLMKYYKFSMSITEICASPANGVPTRVMEYHTVDKWIDPVGKDYEYWATPQVQKVFRTTQMLLRENLILCVSGISRATSRKPNKQRQLHQQNGRSMVAQAVFYFALAFVSIDPVGCVCDYCVASQVEKVLRMTQLMPREGLISCITIINPNKKHQLH